MKRAVFFAGALLAVLSVFLASRNNITFALSGSDWQPGNIVSDTNFTDPNSMSVQQIQDFINSQVNAGGGCDTWGTKPATDWGRSDLTHAQFATQVKGWAGPPYVCLNEYYEVPKTSPTSGMPDNSYNHYDTSSKTLTTVPSGVSAAQIIYNAAQQYQINPKVLLVKIQTESAGPLTQDTWPLSSQYSYALGSHCPDSGPGGSAQCDTTYSGFSMQVYSAAELLRYYLDNMQQPWWTYKIPFTTNSILWNVSPTGCGASNVYISTKGTAALYTYTPYQPNAAALSKVSDATSGGTGDGCSAYGNRNFWWWYAHWFGNPSYPPSPIYIPNGTYNIVGNGSGKDLDVIGGSSANGTNIDLYDSNGTGAQKWTFTRDSEGYYTIQNAASGKYLDVPGGSNSPSTKLQIWDGNGSCAQKWAIQETGTSYVLLSACSGLALDAVGGGKSNGTAIDTYTKNYTAAQLWTLKSLDSPALSDGFYNLLTTSGTALDIPGGGSADGTSLQIYTNNGTGSQIWQITRKTNGLYEVTNPQSGKYLDVAGGGTTAGTRTDIYGGNGSCAQEWAIADNGDGSYSLTSSCSGKKLDVAGGAISASGTAVDIWDSNGTSAQSWKPSKLSTIPNGTYNLLTTSGTALDIPGGSTASGIALQIYTRNGTGSQAWQVIKQSDGLYELRNPQSGKYLDVAGGGTTSGVRVQIWDGNNTCSQEWAIADNGDGSYSLTSSCSTKKLDVLGGAISASGTAVDIWDSNGTSAQSWKLAPQ